MMLPGRYSLLWRLTGILALFCLLLALLNVDAVRYLLQATTYLPEATRTALLKYSEEMEHAWLDDGAAGLEHALVRLRSQEQVWAVVVNDRGQPLVAGTLAEREQRRLRFARPLDGHFGRPDVVPILELPFAAGSMRLVMELPARLNPRKYQELWETLLQRILPVMLAGLLGVLLYRLLIAPLTHLRDQAMALSDGELTARVCPDLAGRLDELGQLSGAFNQMAGRLQDALIFQRHLLRDLSHELRTPLSRLRVASEQPLDTSHLKSRLEQELEVMERLISDSLELIWLDSECLSLPLESINVVQLWDVLCENACFESGWAASRLLCDLPTDCCVMGNLNGLARAMENILRNAIRYSPEGGVVRLGGQRQDACWHLWIEDQGPGVEEAELEQIFQPFMRLNAARPGGEGFGLGLAIARSALRLQGGEIWADVQSNGLRLSLRLKSV